MPTPRQTALNTRTQIGAYSTAPCSVSCGFFANVQSAALAALLSNAVTGASQGIGRATAIRLAKDFSSVVLAARDRDQLATAAAAVNAAGAEALMLDLDLSEVSAAKTVVDESLSRFGRIDALLNIAGAVPQIDVLGGIPTWRIGRRSTT